MLDRAFALTRQAVELAEKHLTAAIGKAVELAGEARKIVENRGSPPPEQSDRVANAEARSEALDSTPTRPAPAPRPPAPPRTPSPPPTPESEHIEVEEELVGEFAEAGAEEPAGPEIEVAEPWPGYASLTASDVVDRLAAASEAERAVVALYERGHKNRKTVLAAAGVS
jgi:hypothetical protein